MFRPVPGAHVYVVAPPDDIVVDEPLHNVTVPPVTVTVGDGFTVITCVPLAVQPLALVPVTVYVVVVVGEHTTMAPVVELSPADGVHV